MSGIRIANSGGSGRRENLADIVAEMDALVGLENVKRELNRFISLSRLAVLRRERELPSVRTNLHMVFSGPPGTGKTVVARKVGRMLKAIRLLKGGDCIEVDRSQLVAPYVGQTATKTREVIERSLDNVLFIDEAYTLTNQGSDRDPFGQEAIDTLLRLMENYRDRLVIIVAGYDGEMVKFINSNPGLASRFSRFVKFNAYSPKDLTQIFENMVADSKMSIDDAGRRAAARAVKDIADGHANDDTFGNARVIRGFFETIVTAQAERLSQQEDLEALADADLQTITDQDIAAAVEAI